MMKSKTARFHLFNFKSPLVFFFSIVALILLVSYPAHSQSPNKTKESENRPEEELLTTTSTPDSYQFEIRVLDKKGKLELAKAPIFPSFSHSGLKFKEFQVNDIQWSESEGYLCTILAKGVCYSPLVNTFSLADSSFGSAQAFLNGDAHPISEVLIEMGRTPEHNQIAGAFDVEIKNVQVTEGLNTFRISVPDPVTSIEGGQTVTFVVNGDGSDTSSAHPKVENIENIENSENESVGEFFQFFIGIKDIPEGEAEKLKLSLGMRGSSKIYDLVPTTIPRTYVLGWEKKPLSFCLLPGKKDFNPSMAKKAAEDIHYLEILSAKTKRKLSDRFQFLVGYGRGIFINGADLIASNGDVIEAAVDFSVEDSNGQIQGQWIRANEKKGNVTIQLPADYTAKQMVSIGLNASPEILWQISKLYRDSDLRAEEVVLSLLTNDYEPLGIENNMLGWRSDFLGKISEPLDAINSTYKSDRPMFHGFTIGMLVGTGAQLDLPPVKSADPGQKWRPAPHSKILQHTLKVLEALPAPGVKQLKVNVPEKYAEIWPLLSIYYAMVWEDNQETNATLANLLPDWIKHPILSPIFMILAMTGIFAGSIWFLVEEFKVSLGWGFGQLAANVISCCLIIPGYIVGLVFLCLHWEQAKLPFTISLIGWVLAFFSLLFVPSWTRPV